MNPWKSPELSFRKRHLPHLEVPDVTYFISFSTLHRFELPPQARDLLMAELRSLEKSSIDLDAAVVMPDHAHAIFRLTGTITLTQILKNIKGRTAHRINEIIGNHGQVWNQETFDHIVRSESRVARQNRIHPPESAEERLSVISSPVQMALRKDGIYSVIIEYSVRKRDEINFILPQDVLRSFKTSLVGCNSRN